MYKINQQINCRKINWKYERLIWSESRRKWHTGGRQPCTASYKVRNSEPGCHICTSYNMITRPLDPVSGARRRSKIIVFSIVQSGQSKIWVLPSHPPIWSDQTVNKRLENYSSWILLPRPAEVGFELCHHRFKVRRGRDPRVVDRNSGILKRVTSSLSCYYICLTY